MEFRAVNILKREKLFLLLIFFLSFLLNFSFFHFFIKKGKDYLRGDTPEYHNIAVQIANGNGISDIKGVPNYYRVPGYACFLAFCYKLFNFDVIKTLYFQTFLSAIIPVLVFVLSIVIFPSNILLAKISSLFMTFNFGTILYSGFLMSESVFMIFFLMFCIVFFPSFKFFFIKTHSNVFSYKPSPRLRFINNKFFISGVLLGITSLIRPVGHFIIFVVIILLFLSNFNFKKKIISSTLLFLGWFLIVSWWFLRNFLLTSHIFFHSMIGSHFLYFFTPDVYGQETKIDFLHARETLKKQWKEDIKNNEKIKGRKLNDFEIRSLAKNVSFRCLKKFPVGTVKRGIINICKTLCGFHVSVLIYKYSKSFPGYNTVTSLFDKLKCYLFPNLDNKLLIFIIYFEFFWMIFVFLGFLGGIILSLFRVELLSEFLKFLPLISLLLVLTFGIGLARLRFAFEPFLIIFSSYFWIFLLNKIKCNEFFNL
ncbi:hypothetical protein KAT08_01765 [Candidatus Babeliales bacterium]|nr:hypothetical protein [Candidatus Babeliales bacterium]